MGTGAARSSFSWIERRGLEQCKLMRVWTIPTLALIAVLGVGGGVHLGRSATAEIGPRYIEEAGSRSFAGLSPYRGPERAYPSTVGADTGFGSGCIGCREFPEEYYPRPDLTPDDGAASAWTPAEEPPLAYAVHQAGIEAEPEPEPAFAEVERYTHYPVASEDAPEPPVTQAGSAE